MVAVTWGSLGVALLTNSVICAIVLTVFNIMRKNKHARKYFNAKRYLRVPFRYRPKKLGSTLTTWWKPLFSYSDEEIYATAGMDALTYIRYLRLGVKMSVAVGFVSLVMILPTNWAGGSVVDDRMAEQEAAGVTDAAAPADAPAEEEEAAYVYTDFDKTSMGNIPDQDSLLWVHLVGIYLISFIVMKLLWSAHEEAVSWRVRYLAGSRKGAESHTVLVRDVPGTPYGTINAWIYSKLDGTLGKVIPASVRAKAEAAVTGTANAAGAGAARQSVGALMGAKLPDKDPVTENVYVGGQQPGDASERSEIPPTDGSGTQEPLSPVHTRHDNPLTENVADAAVADGGGKRTGAAASASAPPLSQYVPERPATDFKTDAHAAEALRRGLPLEALVEREFKRSYPGDGEVQKVSMIKRNNELGNALTKYEKARLKLEDYIDGLYSKMRRGKPIKPAQTRIVPLMIGAAAVEKYGNKPVKVDVGEHLEWHAQQCLRDVIDAQKTAGEQDTCSAFVTFASRRTQAQAVTSLHYHDESFWTVSAAPGPLEVVWQNISYRGWERSLRLAAAWGLFIFMMLTFMIPVTFVQGLIAIDNLDSWPGVSFILDQPFLRGIVQSVLPGLALTIFLALVPMIITFFNNIQGVYSESGLDFELGRKYFVFQYILVFLLGVVGGTLLTSAEEAADDFGQWLEDLGGQIPRTANFFLTFTLVQALIALPVSLLRVVGLVIFMILAKLSGSDRAKRRLWAQQYTKYGTDIPKHSLTLVYLLVFAIQQPFICVACFLYFVAALFVAQYQFLYVFREKYQSGGRFWPIIYQQVIVALFTFQIVMAVLLLLQRFAAMPLALIPIVITVIFNRAAMAKFERPLDNLSVHAAADLDRSDKTQTAVTPEEEAAMLETMDCEDTAFGPPEELYVAPGFKVKGDDLNGVLRELEVVREKVAQREAAGPDAMKPMEAVPEEEDDDVDDDKFYDLDTVAGPTANGAGKASGEQLV